MKKYLIEGRLNDIVAAIQAMGTYKYYKLDFKGWADRITGDENLHGHWATVFQEHPEFFRLDSDRQKASLVMRRQHPKRFHVDLGQEITTGEFYSLDENTRATRISRSPLSGDEIAGLIDTAVRLHAHGLEAKRDSRHLLKLAVPVIGSLAGVIVGAYL